ncbi:APA family basic amino acid/polyamine antiporter [Dysgonomonas hofstadii]|uniref:APA family basic amino acid/polyamine antiporter n=1 Tax=Dysgonomonas hofstadii TaxID=637886 RepID=A0A840CQY9_9BACT|nr:amino acid permease [Dysgonomonas hofstadii]MBB4035345.1 APA family basic amino acid/polyamine antiporter [Dysgonomonas hofstadii]
MTKRQVTKISIYTGMSIVVANMIGTGAFTSLGFQLVDLSNTGAILSLWILGGLLALSGAFSYAEVGTVIKRSGGEFAFLSQIYHPVIGYLSGWISLTVGFAAPIALAVIAFTEYFPISTAYPKLIGILLIAGITLIHSFSLNSSSKFQNITTLLKVSLIAILIITGLALPAGTENAINFEKPYLGEITSTAFAVSLIYVSYSYSGWNAAAYITEEFKNPVKALPIALIGGTLVVTLLYTLLQFVFLKHVPLAELTGKLNVGTIAVQHMLGDQFAKLFGVAISLLLISGISAMVWVGPRVTASIAKEYSLWKYFKDNAKGIPVKALWLQFLISVILILSGTFEQIMIYCGVLLSVSCLLVVIGTFILRVKNKDSLSKGFKSPLFPLFQIFFIVISLWMIGFAFFNNPIECIIGLSNILLGLATYFLSIRLKQS